MIGAATSRFAESVRSSSASLSLRELLEQPVTELLGVGRDAATALVSIDVQTIFDLGSSAAFAQASSALAAASSDLGLLASDVLDADGSAVPVSEVPDLPLDRLQGISEPVAAALASALDAPTIRDLALWPPRQVAHELVTIAAGTDLGDTADESAEELRPALGEYPTERVYYDTLVMLATEPPQNQTPLSQPLSLEQLAVAGLAFGAPAVGALATYSQSWFAQAVTLGHMVHSLALAPGEATRVAVLDWSRRTMATAAESIEEREQLDDSTNHARAVSEVQNAVADEMQSGGSISTGWAKSTSKASGFAGSVGGGVAGAFEGVTGVLGFGGGGSKSSQESETQSRATSASWSVGSRSVMAEMNQRVNDRTEQHATSVRNRRATAVREVSETEHEQVSTRIVANYNHMHALTVQYYEVVQIYRVSVQLNNFVRALFLPFELLDFSAANAADIVARFRGQLLAAALTPRAAELLLDDRGRIEVRSAVRIAFPISVGTLAGAKLGAAPTRLAMRAAESGEGPRLAMRAAESGEGPAGAGGGGGSAGAGGDGGGATTADGTGASDGPAHPAPGPGFQFAIVRPGPVVEVIPGDARLVSIAFEDVSIDRVRVDQPSVAADSSTFVVSDATNQVDFPNGIPLRRIDSIHVARDGGTVSDGSMVMRYQSDGSESMAVVPLSLVEGTAMQKVAFLAGDAADRRAELRAHLQANRSYYTRAVLERLDAASLVLLLSGISWLGKPLADQVEPNPIAVTGNFLVLRAPAEAGDPSGVAGFPTWRDLLRDRDIDFKKQDTRLVPIPTGGVFAEAVLGRSNSAEKLDITRFWNWQDSPIPLQPPEIAPVGTETRALPEDLLPGQLGAPILNIQPPTPLPEPAGLTAALGALASANLFRDMSGLAGTQAAAQAASAGTLAAATEAGRIASANYQAATNQATEMGKAAADMWKVLNSGGSGGSGKRSTAGISRDGAQINQGRDMDRRGLTGGSGGAAGSGGPAPQTPAEMQPTFAASDGAIPGVGPFSREVSYSDESAAVSPHLIGTTTAALGAPTSAAGGADVSGLQEAGLLGGPLTSAVLAAGDNFDVGDPAVFGFTDAAAGEFSYATLYQFQEWILGEVDRLGRPKSAEEIEAELLNAALVQRDPGTWPHRIAEISRQLVAVAESDPNSRANMAAPRLIDALGLFTQYKGERWLSLYQAPLFIEIQRMPANLAGSARLKAELVQVLWSQTTAADRDSESAGEAVKNLVKNIVNSHPSGVARRLLSSYTDRQWFGGVAVGLLGEIIYSILSLPRESGHETISNVVSFTSYSLAGETHEGETTRGVPLNVGKTLGFLIGEVQYAIFEMIKDEREAIQFGASILTKSLFALEVLGGEVNLLETGLAKALELERFGILGELRATALIDFAIGRLEEAEIHDAEEALASLDKGFVALAEGIARELVSESFDTLDDNQQPVHVEPLKEFLAGRVLGTNEVRKRRGLPAI